MKLFSTWRHMIARCYNPKVSSYKNYGARGISVCREWRESYKRFVSDVGDKPTPSHSLDRINNNGNYEPSNVRWATQKQQCRNTRFNRMVEIGGNLITVAEFAELLGEKQNSVLYRIRRGWTIAEISCGKRFIPSKSKITKLADEIIARTKNGETSPEIAKELGIYTSDVCRLLKKRGVECGIKIKRDARARECKRLRATGLTLKQVGQEMGTTVTTVVNYLKRPT